MTPGLVIGATRTANREVLAEHTVQRVPGCAWLARHGLPVLASAALVGLVEDAIWEVVTPHLGWGECLVGGRFRWPHEAPAFPGEVLEIAMVCTTIRGSALYWRVHVHVGDRRIARFRHRAVVVQRTEYERRMQDLRNAADEPDCATAREFGGSSLEPRKVDPDKVEEREASTAP